MTWERKVLPVPIKELCTRYEDGESLRDISADFPNVSEDLIRRRLKDAGVKMRGSGPSRREKVFRRHHWLDSKDIARFWDEGLTCQEIADHFGIGKATVYKRLYEVIGTPEERRLRKLYEEEELPQEKVARKMHMDETTLRDRLKEYGIPIRRKGNKPKLRVAQTPSLREIQRAAAVRATQRSEDTRQNELNPRQRDLLDILRASPKPISTGRIKRVAEAFPSLQRALEANSVHKSLTYLEKRGLIESVGKTRTGNWRGRKINLWWPADESLSVATSEEDAARLREIQVLVEAQEEDAHGYEKWSGSLSLDAPVTEDGFTILDTLGDEDENLTELLG